MMCTRTAHRTFLALALLSVMWLGLACHYWHHLTDPDCDTSRAAQPCATCSALHAAAIVTHPETVARPLTIPIAEVSLPETGDSAAPSLAGFSPRGPPSA